MNVLFWILVALTGLWVLAAIGVLVYLWPGGEYVPMTEVESAAMLRGFVIGQIL